MQELVNRVNQAIQDFKNGKMVVLTDHPDREDEGDFIMPAETITPEAMNFMIRNGTGVVCVSLLHELAKKFELEPIYATNDNVSLRAPFTMSIDAANNITTGVSAADRTVTIKTLLQDNAKPSDLVKPGHMFPLLAQDNGVLARQGHTEGSVDLTRLAGFKPVAVLCEIMNPDGTMTRGKQLYDFAEKHQLSILSIDDLITYRLQHENLIIEEATATLPLEKYGTFNITVVKDKVSNTEHTVLSKVSTSKEAPLVRLHSSCVTGDLFSSLRCDCHQQLHYSLDKISKEGGILIYLNQEGRGIGLMNKIKAYALQEKGMDTVEANEQLGLPADPREYHIAANILRNMKINKIRLLTNNTDKITGLKRFGIENITREKMPIFDNVHNQKYLKTKKNKLGHEIDLD